MTFNKEKWEAVYKQCAKVQSEKGHGPSDGIVCIHATLKYLTDGLHGKKDVAAELKELYSSCCEAKTLSGFASNASGAAKACELTVTNKASAFSEF